MPEQINNHPTHLLSKKAQICAAFFFLLLAFLQSPGRISPDTKLDLTANPLGFLGRALHIWSPTAPLGQVQNQAYGYFFPHGAFFSLGQLAHLPPWVVQRLWWALLLWVGFVGIVKVAQALRIGNFGSQVIAGLIYALSPRVLTTIGSISSETLPAMLAPWVLLPVILALNVTEQKKSTRQLALQATVAVALMGAVNAIATVAAVSVAGLWWLIHFPRNRKADNHRWWSFTGWAIIGGALAITWWVAPLFILGSVSPPFLDYIESSRITTQWTSLVEVARGTNSWTPFVSSERIAGVILVSQPAAVIASGIIMTAGIIGLVFTRNIFRGRLLTLTLVGIALITAGYTGPVGPPWGTLVTTFLDDGGAAFRNVHKWDPLIRLPLALGCAALLALVPFPKKVTFFTKSAWEPFLHPERSRSIVAVFIVLIAVLTGSAPALVGKLAPEGSYRNIPHYWKQTGDWLTAAAQASHSPTPPRALVVPGAPFANQLWGLTRDEPLQALTDAPWVVRDAIPLTPPGAIRALDSVQQAIADGRASSGLAATLAGQGIGYIIVRADLASDARAARPLLALQAISHSPGLTRVASFGNKVGPVVNSTGITDEGLRPPLPAITIFSVNGIGIGGPTLTSIDEVTAIYGGPEAILRINNQRLSSGLAPLKLTELLNNSQKSSAPAIATDTATRREIDFGRVDNHSSAVLGPGLPDAPEVRTTQSRVTDYPSTENSTAPGTLTEEQWLLNNSPDAVSVTSSGSASDAVQLGQTRPGSSPAAAFDDDESTAWVSRGVTQAVGQWLQINFANSRNQLTLRLTTAPTIGAEVNSILIRTEQGSVVHSNINPGKPVTIITPAGNTRWIQLRALTTKNGTAGAQFAIAEVTLEDTVTSLPIKITRQLRLPTLLPHTNISGWSLGQDFPGRSDCVNDSTSNLSDPNIMGPIMRCSNGLGISPEEPGIFSRSLSVPRPRFVNAQIWLRPRPGAALNQLLGTIFGVSASGNSISSHPAAQAQASVDGDPGTSWISAAPTAPTDGRSPKTHPKKTPPRPRLQLRLPKKSLVSSLKILGPAHSFDANATYPARPTEVSIDLGRGAITKKLNSSGIVPLTATFTDTITITVRSTRDILNFNSLGFTENIPAGIAEVSLYGVDGKQIFPTQPNRPLLVDCAHGPQLTLGNVTQTFSIATTTYALTHDEAVAAQPCSTSPYALPEGRVTAIISPTPAFSVLSAAIGDLGGKELGGKQLGGKELGGKQPGGNSLAEISDWRVTHRSIDITAASHKRVLAIPESVNPGWEASINGQRLETILINGWQQGWLIPANTSGMVTLKFPLDIGYRWGLGVGVILLGLLIIWAFIPTRKTISQRAPSALQFSPLAGSIVTAIAVIALAGIAGVLATTLAIGGVYTYCRYRKNSTPNSVALTTITALLGISMFFLASGPWTANSYHGFSGWLQLMMAAALGMASWFGGTGYRLLFREDN